MATPREFSHLVEIDEAQRLLRIHRVFADGSRHFFTETTLPLRTRDALTELALMLGENILFDSPAARRVLGL